MDFLNAMEGFALVYSAVSVLALRRVSKDSRRWGFLATWYCLAGFSAWSELFNEKSLHFHFLLAGFIALLLFVQSWVTSRSPLVGLQEGRTPIVVSSILGYVVLQGWELEPVGLDLLFAVVGLFAVQSSITNLRQHRFPNIGGLPGVYRSALLILIFAGFWLLSDHYPTMIVLLAGLMALVLFLVMDRSSMIHSELMEADSRLRDSVEEQARFFRVSLDLFCIMDSKGCFKRLNSAWENILGYRIEDMEGKRFLDFVHSDDQKKAHGFLSDLPQKEGNATVLVRFRGKSGEHRYLEWDGTCNGELAYAAARDITNQVSAMELLVREKKTAQLYLDIAGVMFVALDCEGRIRQINRKGCEILGYEERELLGKDWFRLCVSQALSDELRDAFGKVISGEILVVDFEQPSIVAKDGSERIMSFHNTMLKNEAGSIVGMLCSGEDITRQKIAQQELLDLNERFKLAVQSAEIGVWDWDLSSNRLVWDGRMYSIYGVRREEFPDPVVVRANGWHPDDRNRVKEEIHMALRGVKDFDTEFRICHPNGQIRHIKAFARVLRDKAGQALRMTGVNYDITTRKQADHELMKAKDAAEAASRFKSEFLANISHEIRTPLNSVIGYGELLSEIVSDEKARAYLQSIHVASKALLTLINDILDLSKIEAGRLDIEPRPMSLRNLFQELQQIFMLSSSLKGIELSCKVADSIPDRVLLDEVRMRQVLLNMIGNAVKCTAHGHVKVRCLGSAEDGMVRDLRVMVEDTGIGIEFDQQLKIFEAFRQQSGQSRHALGGTGLGLTISRKLVEMMGGAIQLQSVPGAGSTFTVLLGDVIVVQGEPGGGPASLVTGLVTPVSEGSASTLSLELCEWGADDHARLSALEPSRRDAILKLLEGAVEMGHEGVLAKEFGQMASVFGILELERVAKDLNDSAERFDIGRIQKLHRHLHALFAGGIDVR